MVDWIIWEDSSFQSKLEGKCCAQYVIETKMDRMFFDMVMVEKNKEQQQHKLKG